MDDVNDADVLRENLRLQAEVAAAQEELAEANGALANLEARLLEAERAALEAGRLGEAVARLEAAVADAGAQRARVEEELAEERRRVAALEASVEAARDGTDDPPPAGAFRELFRRVVRHGPPSGTGRPE